MRLIILLCVVILGAGCACRSTDSLPPPTQVTTPGITGGNNQLPADAPAYVETLRFRQTEAEVTDLLGKPSTVLQKDQQTAWWVYEGQGLKVGFLKQQLFSVIQTKGRLSVGIGIGDPEGRVGQAGLQPVEKRLDQITYLLDRGDGKIYVIVKGGKVSSFILMPYSDMD